MHASMNFHEVTPTCAAEKSTPIWSKSSLSDGFTQNDWCASNLPVNWPKLLGPLQNGFTTFFLMRHLFTSTRKESDIIF